MELEVEFNQTTPYNYGYLRDIIGIIKAINDSNQLKVLFETFSRTLENQFRYYFINLSYRNDFDCPNSILRIYSLLTDNSNFKIKDNLCGIMF